MKNQISTWALIVSLVLVGACNRSCSGKKNSPEQAVETYLNTIFNIKSLADKQELLDQTTGSLNEAIASASDTAFVEAYVDPKHDLQKFSILDRRDITPRETNITFRIVYKNMAPEGPEEKLKPEEIPTVTVDNTVALLKVDKVWKIREVLNKKSQFDFPVSPEGMEIKPSSAGEAQ